MSKKFPQNEKSLMHYWYASISSKALLVTQKHYTECEIVFASSMIKKKIHHFPPLLFLSLPYLPFPTLLSCPLLSHIYLSPSLSSLRSRPLKSS